MKTFQEFFISLPSDSNSKGKTFEGAIKWWLSCDPIWSSQFKTVWLWNEFPQKNTRDTGIDLVAESMQGELWAIQCKAYDPNSNLKKSDIDSFLSASSRKLYSHRLLVTTTRTIGSNARETLSAQEKPVSVVDWARLCSSPVNWESVNNKKLESQIKFRELRPHQRNAMNSVVKGFENSDRGQLIMACGSGKTLTALRIHEELDSNLTIVLVPSLTLLSQTLGDWLQDRKSQFNWLAVCSDESVSNDPQDNTKLIDFDFPATTKPSLILAFLKKKGKKVIFSTYHSSPRVLQAIQGLKIDVDLVICDEAHRLAGKTGRGFSSLVDSKVRIAKRLFMTATHRIYSPGIKEIVKNHNFEILSMDDQKIFGERFFTYTFSQAIKDEILTDYRVVVIGVDNKEVAQLLDKKVLVKAGLVETVSESLALHIALTKAIKKWNLRRLISFHSRVVKARKFGQDQKLIQDWLPKSEKLSGSFNVETISSSMPTDKRRIILDVLKNVGNSDTNLVTNARCLTEGIDVPSLDGVVFVDPKSSQVDIIQAVGRAIRRGGESKTHGTIVIPICVSSKSKTSFNFDTTNYKKIGDVLSALRAHDPEFGDEIDKLRVELGHKGSIDRVPEKIIWDLPISVGKEFIREVQALVIELASSSWEFMYGLLLRFIDENSHAQPASKEVFQGHWLGYWVGKQRQYFRLNTLSQERVDKLRALGSAWSWDPLDDDWNRSFNLLVDYVAKNGSSRVSSKGIDRKIGKWCADQRRAYGQKKLPSSRIKLLEMVSDDWTWDPKEQDWDDKFELLKQFEDREGHTEVSATHMENGVNLGHWVHAQRSYYFGRRPRGKVTDERKIKLETLKSWSWAPKQDNLDRRFYLLQKFVDENNTSQVPIGAIIDGFQIGKWVAHLRDAYRKGKLHSVVIKRIEDNFTDWQWNPFIDGWSERFALFQEYIKENDSSRISNDYIYKGFKLGLWVANQKSKYSKGKLDQVGARLLESSHQDWTWSLLDSIWLDNFAKLKSYFEKHGDTEYPSDNSTESQVISEWIVTQRKALKKGKILGERKALLDSIEFRWNPRDPWAEAYEDLLKFVEREGHAQVHWKHIENGRVLGKWVSHQRANYKLGELNSDQISKLEQLPGWEWSPLAAKKKSLKE